MLLLLKMLSINNSLTSSFARDFSMLVLYFMEENNYINFGRRGPIKRSKLTTKIKSFALVSGFKFLFKVDDKIL